MKIKPFLLMAGLFAATFAACAQKQFSLDLWPSGAPTDNGDPADTARAYVFLPERAKSTGRAVVICPGGGYGRLAMQHEGYDWAPFFNERGIAAVVLKYRMPHGRHEVPASDAEAALRLVRRNAAAWGIKPGEVGIMGFSAGGHLASTVATRGRGEARPDFQILFYPVISMLPDTTHRGSHDALLGADAPRRLELAYSNDLAADAATPRAFIALSDDDTGVMPLNGVSYYAALKRHGVAASLHVFPSGGHGWGMNSYFKSHDVMLRLLADWLRSF